MLETTITTILNLLIRDIFAVVVFFVLVRERAYIADPKSLAMKCYAIADAMLERRDSKKK